MSAVNSRAVIGVLAVMAIAGSAAYYLVVQRPIDVEAARLQRQISKVKRQKDAAVRQMMAKNEHIKEISAEINRLKLFDLRRERAVDAVLSNRSNVGLIAISEICQRNNLIIDALTPGAFEPRPVAVEGVPQGGILHRSYLIKGQGRYEDVQRAFSELKDLPPTLVIDHYDIDYLGSDVNKAIIYFNLDFGFNYLVSQPQYDRFLALYPSNTASSSADANGLGGLLQGAGNFFQGRPAASGSVSWLPGMLERAGSWLVPPAYAVAEAPNVLPTVNPRLINGGKPLPRGTASASLTLKTIGRATDAGGNSSVYRFVVRQGVSLGRAEPFLPLQAMRMVVPFASDSLSATMSHAPALNAPALPETRVLAILVGNDGQSSALLQVGAERLRVRAGSYLAGGAQIAGIGKDFVLIRTSNGLRKLHVNEVIGASGVPAPPSVPDSSARM